jgi:hypothetical protein
MLAVPAGASADKGDLKTIGFDVHFSLSPEENPDVVDVYEGDTIKVVLHQSNVFGKEGLTLPDKDDIEAGETYFVYPGTGCAEDCLGASELRPAEVYPFAHNYYLIAPEVVGKNQKVVLMDRAVVLGEDITEPLPAAYTPASPSPPPAAPPAPADEAEEPCGDPDHPCVPAVPLDEAPGSGAAFTPVSWSPAVAAAGYSPDEHIENTMLGIYYSRCSGQPRRLSYSYWIVDGGVVERKDGHLHLPAYPAGQIASPFEDWFEGAVEDNNGPGSPVHARYADGRITLTAKNAGVQATFPEDGLVPDGTVVRIRVENQGRPPCESALLGFPESRTFQFPFTSTMPPELYAHKKYARAKSEVCEVDEPLGEALRPRLPGTGHKVLKCPFEKKAVLAGPFWAFFTSMQTYKQDDEKVTDIRIHGSPVLVMSNGQDIVNIEGRVSYDGSAAVSESFHSPTLDSPIYYYLIENAKPGVYAITPVIQLEDPYSPTGKPIEKPGRVILIKVQTREAYSMIRLQMGVVAYREFRAMAFTAIITPVLNPKTFFKRKFLPAYYPMPHIGLRLGSQEDILGLQIGLGIALLKEFIIVGGFQFGTRDLTTPWDYRKSWYIGVAIDPWLLQKSIAMSVKEG